MFNIVAVLKDGTTKEIIASGVHDPAFHASGMWVTYTVPGGVPVQGASRIRNEHWWVYFKPVRNT